MSSSRPAAPLSPRFREQLRDLEAWISETPEHATVKGMYADAVLQALKRSGSPLPDAQRYISFKDYPLKEFMRLALDASQTLYPQLSPAEGLTRLGHTAYSTLLGSTVGKVLFSVAVRSWEGALHLCPKAWEISLKPATVRLLELTPHSARLEMRDVWNFTTTYQVGIFEAAMQAYGLRGTVQPELQGKRCDVDLLLQWETD